MASSFGMKDMFAALDAPMDECSATTTTIIGFGGELVGLPEAYSGATRYLIEILGVDGKPLAGLYAYRFSKHANPKKPVPLVEPKSLNASQLSPALGSMLARTDNSAAFPFFEKIQGNLQLHWTPSRYFKVAEATLVFEVPMDALPSDESKAKYLRFPLDCADSLSGLSFGPKPVYNVGPAWSDEEAAQMKTEVLEEETKRVLPPMDSSMADHAPVTERRVVKTVRRTALTYNATTLAAELRAAVAKCREYLSKKPLDTESCRKMVAGVCRGPCKSKKCPEAAHAALVELVLEELQK